MKYLHNTLFLLFIYIIQKRRFLKQVKLYILIYFIYIEFSFQEGSIYNSENNLTNPDAECQTEPIESDIPLKTTNHIITDTATKTQVEVLMDFIILFKNFFLFLTFFSHFFLKKGPTRRNTAFKSTNSFVTITNS